MRGGATAPLSPAESEFPRPSRATAAARVRLWWTQLWAGPRRLVCQCVAFGAVGMAALYLMLFLWMASLTTKSGAASRAETAPTAAGASTPWIRDAEQFADHHRPALLDNYSAHSRVVEGGNRGGSVGGEQLLRTQQHAGSQQRRRLPGKRPAPHVSPAATSDGRSALQGRAPRRRASSSASPTAPLPPTPAVAAAPPWAWSWRSLHDYTAAPGDGWPGAVTHNFHLPLPAAWAIRPPHAAGLVVTSGGTGTGAGPAPAAGDADPLPPALRALAAGGGDIITSPGGSHGVDADDGGVRQRYFAAHDAASTTFAPLGRLALGMGAAAAPSAAPGSEEAEDAGVAEALATAATPLPSPAAAASFGAPWPTLPADPERREAVREAFLHSWRAYVAHAWGADTLKPVSQTADDGFLHMGISITDSLDTLWIMGLREEFGAGVAWVTDSLTFDHQEDVNLFETTIRVVGGLLAAWELSGRAHPALLAKTVDLADRLLAAFDSPTGLPYGTLGLRSRRKYNPAWVGGGSTIAEVATLQLELEALSAATGEPKYALAGRRVMTQLQTVEPPADSLMGMFISPDDAGWRSTVVTLGARGDSAYEYLLKQYLLAGGVRAAEAAAAAAAAAAAGKAQQPQQHPPRSAAAAGASAAAGAAAALAGGLAGNPALLARGTPLQEYAPLGRGAREAWGAASDAACADLLLLGQRRQRQHQQQHALPAAPAAPAAGAAAEPAEPLSPPPSLPLHRLWYACTDAYLTPCAETATDDDGSGASADAHSLAAQQAPPESSAGSVAALRAAAHSAHVAFPWHVGVDPRCWDGNASVSFSSSSKSPAPAAAAADAAADAQDDAAPALLPSHASAGFWPALPADAPAAAAAVEDGGGRQHHTVRSDALTEAAYFTSLLGMYARASAGIEQHLLRHSRPGGWAFLTERHGAGVWDDKQDHLVCFYPGVLALASRVLPAHLGGGGGLSLPQRQLQLAEELLATCLHTYDMTATKLAPEITRFPGGGDPVVDPGARHNLLRPETAESLLVLYRATGKQEYRDAGWRMLQAFNEHSRVPAGGYSTLRDVDAVPAAQADVMESFFLAETCKYLYLLFDSSAHIALDAYVFNTEAHPLPVFRRAA